MSIKSSVFFILFCLTQSATVLQSGLPNHAILPYILIQSQTGEDIKCLPMGSSICSHPFQVSLCTPIVRGKELVELFVEAQVALLQFEFHRPLVDDGVLAFDPQSIRERDQR